MSGGINTFLGALIAALILLVSSIVTLFVNDPNLTFGQISQAAWVSILGGFAVAFLKDFQAVWTRRQINKLTGSGDGGGTVIAGILVAICASALLVGCSSSFSKPLAYGYSTLTAINDTAADEVQAGTMTAADATDVLEMSGCIDGLLDSARNVWEAGQIAEAQAQLAVAIALISELQNYSGDWTDERCSP